MKKLFFALLSMFTLGAFAQIEVHSNGFVGVGTGTPQELFHVFGGTRTNFVRLVGGTVGISVPSDNGWARGLTYYPNGTFSGAIGGFGLYGSGTTLNRMYMTFGNSPHSSTDGIQILPNGNVGIGTISPFANLETKGIIRISNANGSNPIMAGSLEFIESGTVWGTNAYGFKILHQGVENSLRIQSNATTTVTDIMTLMRNGNVGIGITNPQAELNLGSGVLQVGVDDPNDPNDYWTQLHNNRLVFNRGTTSYIDFANNSNSLSFRQGSAFTTVMHINSSGDVGIGTTDAFGHKLAVNGTIRAKESIMTDASLNWPDYVFENNYNLLSLKEVENHIEEKGHLPNIPSAKEVEEKGGVALGEMNKKLLEKVEELTLYLIDQNKQLEKQEKRIKALEEELKKGKK